jgi:hypothetical protein
VREPSRLSEADALGHIRARRFDPEPASRCCVLSHVLSRDLADDSEAYTLGRLGQRVPAAVPNQSPRFDPRFGDSGLLLRYAAKFRQ